MGTGLVSCKHDLHIALRVPGNNHMPTRQSCLMSSNYAGQYAHVRTSMAAQALPQIAIPLHVVINPCMPIIPAPGCIAVPWIC